MAPLANDKRVRTVPGTWECLETENPTGKNGVFCVVVRLAWGGYGDGSPADTPGRGNGSSVCHATWAMVPGT